MDSEIFDLIYFIFEALLKGVGEGRNQGGYIHYRKSKVTYTSGE